MRATTIQYTKLQEDDNNVSNRHKGNILKNYRGIQTKKKPFALGGGPFKVRTGKEKKKINPRRYEIDLGLRKSTKIAINPRRASEKTKKKRELRAQQRDASKVDYNIYRYQNLKVELDKYIAIERELKIAQTTNTSKAEISKLENDRKKQKKLIRHLAGLGKYGTVEPEKISKQIADGIAKYEEKQKYQTDSGQKLKDDAVEYIQNRSEFIKHGQPELKKKLSALTSFDPLKIAVIRVPGQPVKPVNKLKYSDFKVDDPKITNAYLGQFKVVNDSIRKINKDFDIDALSPERRVELAQELHKITVDGIYDPAVQEKHFIKSVTEIAYKNRYYSVLGKTNKDMAAEYLKTLGAIPNPKDYYPDLNLKQQRDLLAQRFYSAKGTEYNQIKTRLAQLDTQLGLTPEIIDAKRQVLEGQLKVLPVTNPKYQEIQDEIERLKIQADERTKTKQAIDSADTELINKNIAVLEQKLKAQKNNGNNHDKIKYAIDVYRELLPENIDKYKNKNVYELEKIYKGFEQNKNEMYKLGDPQLPEIYESFLSKMKNMLDIKRSQEAIARRGNLSPSKQALLLSQIGPKHERLLSTNNIDKIQSNKFITLMDAAQRTAKLKEHAILNKQKAKTDIIQAKQDAWKRGKISGIKSVLVNSAAVKDAKTRTRLFAAEEYATDRAGKMYTSAMKKGLKPEQEVIKTKYGTIRLGNKARTVNNLVQARIKQTEYASANNQRNSIKQLSVIRSALNKGAISSSTAKKLLAKRGEGISNNVAKLINKIQTRKADKRSNALAEMKKVKTGKLFRAISAFSPEKQHELLTNYKNDYERQSSYKKNNNPNKAKYEHIANMLTKKLNELETKHPELKSKVNENVNVKSVITKQPYTKINVTQQPEYALPSPAQPVKYERASPEQNVKYVLASPGPAYPVVEYKSVGELPSSPVNYATVSSQEPVNNPEYATSSALNPKAQPEIYANLGSSGALNPSPYEKSTQQLQPNIQPTLNPQGTGFPSANNLKAARAKLRKVHPLLKEEQTNNSNVSTLERKQRLIRAEEKRRDKALSALQPQTLFQKAAQKIMQKPPNQ